MYYREQQFTLPSSALQTLKVIPPGEKQSEKIKKRWTDKDFFPDYKGSPVWTHVTGVPSPKMLGEQTVGSLMEMVRYHIYTKILMKKGLPLEMAAMIVLPIVMRRRHWTLPTIINMERASGHAKRERQRIYDFISGSAFHVTPYADTWNENHGECFWISKGGDGWPLHNPECHCRGPGDNRNKGPSFPPEEPSIIDKLVNLGSSLLNRDFDWVPRYDFNDSKEDPIRVQRRKEIRKRMAANFIWDPETQEAIKNRKELALAQDLFQVGSINIFD